MEEYCDISTTYYLCQDGIKKDIEVGSCVHKKRETTGLLEITIPSLFFNVLYPIMAIIISLYILTVFPNEFEQKGDGQNCKSMSDNIIKNFHFRNEFLLDEASALRSCQRYCSRNQLCWGCSLTCHDENYFCHDGYWSAIKECRSAEPPRLVQRSLASQKPSNNTINHIFLFENI